MAKLLKFKVLLNLIISDLLRVILAALLFAAIVAAILGGLTYQRWLPAVSSYLQSIDNALSNFAPSPSLQTATSTAQ